LIVDLRLQDKTVGHIPEPYAGSSVLGQGKPAYSSTCTIYQLSYAGIFYIQSMLSNICRPGLTPYAGQAQCRSTLYGQPFTLSFTSSLTLSGSSPR
jgi:hypothetical protein